MKKLISTISSILCCISIVSCGNSPTNTAQENSVNPVIQSQPSTSSEPQTSAKNESTQKPETPIQTITPQTEAPKQPKIGTVKELVNGDLLCYVTLVDESGTQHNVGASFEICAEEAKFLNKKVRASYQIESVSDCQSAEPCGKTRKESIITKMEVLEKKSSSKSSPSANNKSHTISNGEWTITVGNGDSWKGVNNTGNLSYKGCDAKGKCLELTGGRVSCRDGKCVTGWTNGDYIYILEQPITEDGNSSSTLIVRKGDQEIIKAIGLK